MSKNIPIKNIYYLLIYAWDRYQEGKSINLEIEKSPDLPNLLSDLLFKLMCRVIKKGLDKDYKDEIETTSFLKGKILFNEVLKKNSIKRGKLVIQNDDLNNDTPINRYIKITLLNLKRNRKLKGYQGFVNKLGYKELDGLNPDEIKLKLDQIMDWNDNEKNNTNN